QFDANKKNLVWAFGYTVFGLLAAIGVVLLGIYFDGVRHSFGALLRDLLGPSGVLLVLLIGVVVAAVRCLAWVFHDEFRAVAVGRKVFLLWVVISAAYTFLKHIPAATVTAPAAAVVAHEQRAVPAAGARDRGGQRDVLVVDAHRAKITEITWKDWAK